MRLQQIALTFISALMLAVLLVGQASAPVSAAPLAEDVCGDTYTVVRGDYLTKIANLCGTTIGDIVALNPGITNPNLIYTGTVLRLTGNAPITYPTGGTTSFNGATNAYNGLQVTVSTTRASAGDEITVTINGFPANMDIDYRVGQYGEGYTEVYDANTDTSGYDSQVITIPSDADQGEYWIVYVVTTGQAVGLGLFSHTIYISNDYTYITNSGTPTVSLSKTSAEAGESVTVYVSGFPKNASIDYRIGEYGKEYTVAYDGAIDADGNDTFTFTMPGEADKGENWIVRVQTTDQVVGVTITSRKIYIDN